MTTPISETAAHELDRTRDRPDGRRGGFTLGGGIGLLARAHGLTADNLAAAEVVPTSRLRCRVNQNIEPAG